MKNPLITYILLLLLVIGVAPKGYAATTAEASTGHAKLSIGKYDISGLTEEEQEWFQTFLEGNLFAEGWQEISSEILMSTLAEEREQQQVLLETLGYKIGREWCKGNDIRKIHTSMLKKWGRELKTAANEAPHLLTVVLKNIDQQVDELLN